MMFYGRISDVYMGVITLVVTLILFKFMNATAGDAYRIGNARLGGFNGIPAFPILNVPGDPNVTVYGTPFYYVVSCACSALLSALPLDPRLALRPRADRHPRERGARRAARLQRAGLQDRDLHDQRRRWRGSPAACSPTGPRSSRPSVFSLGQSAEVHHLDDRRRPRHAGRPDARRRSCSATLKLAARPADADRQLAGPRCDPDPGRAAPAARLRCRRFGALAPRACAQSHGARRRQARSTRRRRGASRRRTPSR